MTSLWRLLFGESAPKPPKRKRSLVPEGPDLGSLRGPRLKGPERTCDGFGEKPKSDAEKQATYEQQRRDHRKTYDVKTGGG